MHVLTQSVTKLVGAVCRIQMDKACELMRNAGKSLLVVLREITTDRLGVIPTKNVIVGYLFCGRVERIDNPLS